MSQELKYEIQLDRVQNIALSGIGRALMFIKFAGTGAYDLAAINSPQQEIGRIFSDDFMPPVQEVDFIKWKNDFVVWNLNNAINEIVESFFVFLETICFALHANGTRRRVKSNDVLSDVIRTWRNEVRNNLRNQSKIKALSDKGLRFSDIDKEIIESFWEIRNLLSHNLGISDERNKLNVDHGKISLKWYRREIFVKLESGREIPLTSDPMPEPGDICLRPKVLQTREINLGTHLSFSFDEVQQIAWTFWLIVLDLSAKLKETFDKENAREKVVESI